MRSFIAESWRDIVSRVFLYGVVAAGGYLIRMFMHYMFGADSLARMWRLFVGLYAPYDLPAVGGWTVLMLTYWSFGLTMLFVDITHRPTWLFERRYQKLRPYEWRGSMFNPPLWKTLLLVLFNQICIFLPGYWLMEWASLNTDLLPWRTGIRVELELPSTMEMFVTFSLAVVFEEFLFYYSHRLMHVPFFYANVHKVHHSYKAPHAIASLYAHPFEAFTANLIAMNLPLFVCNFHLLTFYIAISLGWMSSLVGHCGYDLPILSLFIPKHDFHDLHHERFTGNFGTAGWLDWLAGTDIKPFKESAV
jgi:sterol desaturase/sphingolipid hydroxylase (fatty acid hydroxylase superfamily)